MSFPKIGMRNIKTSTSVFLCLLFFNFIARENAIHACIAAVICMQNTIVDSFTKGTERVIGTIIGGIAGGFVLFLVTTFGHENMLIFIIPLGIIILIEACVTFNLKQSVVICCVVYLGILISNEKDGGYILYTFNRVLDTTFGIMIALFVNKYMNIPDNVKELLKYKKSSEISDFTKNQGEEQLDNTDVKTIANIETIEKNKDKK